MHVPCSPHGLIGPHSDGDGFEVVRMGCGVMVFVVVVSVENVGTGGIDVPP